MNIRFEWGSDYRAMWEEQHRLQHEIIERGEEETIIFTTHNPVYTLGKHGKESNLLSIPENVECVRIDRGGDVTYHGPGQLVVYPIVSLLHLHLGVKEYVTLLEQAVIDLLAHYGIRGERVEGATGVWLDHGTPAERKICAIGVKVSRGVTMHGLALNVENQLTPYLAINPCGFVDKGVTSMAKEMEGGVCPGLVEVADKLAGILVPLLKQKVADC